MPIPWHTGNLDRYLEWVEQTIEHSGGYLDGDYLRSDDLDLDGETIGLMLPEQRIQFYDGTRLHFHRLITADVQVIEYGYHYMHDDGTPITRLCEHPMAGPRHPGGPIHYHLWEGPPTLGKDPWRSSLTANTMTSTLPSPSPANADPDPPNPPVQPLQANQAPLIPSGGGKAR